MKSIFIFLALFIFGICNTAYSQGVNIDKALFGDSLCPGGGYVFLSNIRILEDTAGFFGNTLYTTVELGLPPNFEFEPGVGNVSMNGGASLLDIDSILITATKVKFGIINDRISIGCFLLPLCGPTGNCCNPGRITISGLRVRALYSGPPGDILRTGGNAVLFGDSIGSGRSHGSLSTRTVPQPTIIGDTLICSGTNDTLTAITGVIPTFFLWNTFPVSTQQSVVISQSGQYIVRATYLSGCVAYDTINVVISSGIPPVINPSPSAVLCDSSTMTLFAPSGYMIYDWDNGVGSADSINITTTGIHSLVTIDSSGCIGTAYTSIFSPSFQPFISYFGPDTACVGDIVYLGASPGVSYQWWNIADTSLVLSTSFNLQITEEGSYQVEIYDTNSCYRISTPYSVVFQDLPEIDFEIDTYCGDDTIHFNSTSSPGTYPYNDFINSLYWDFGDTTAWSGNPAPKKYNEPGDRLVSLEVTTGIGCTSIKDSLIRIGATPTVDFEWKAICKGDSTLFSDQSSVGFGDSLKFWHWDFSELPTDSIQNPFHIFSDSGVFLCSLTVETNKQCVVTKIDTLHILPVIDFYPYNQSFEAGTGGWFSEGALKTWYKGLPPVSMGNASDGTQSWSTGKPGAYNNSEHSWLNSPCFDLTSLRKPMLAFDYNMITEEGLDGAVLQYTLDDGDNWELVGGIGSGVNWFDDPSIVGLPGGSETGWSQNTSGWKTAKVKLDSLIDEDEVRFRIAFGASPSGPGLGIAVDRFRILEREKIILLEELTNNSNFDDRFANYFLHDIMEDNWKDMVGAFYHVGIPSYPIDSFYSLNPFDAGARQLFYGSHPPPWSIIDGNVFEGSATPFIGFNQAMLDTLMLEYPLFTIDSISVSGCSAPVQIEVFIRYNGEDTLFNPVKVQIEVIEREVNSFVSDNGETTFEWAVKKMLPGQPGTTPPFPYYAPGTQFSIFQSWTMPHFFDCNQLGVVAFVQDVVSNKVYQAGYAGPDGPDITPGFLESDIAQFEFIIFPNPTNEDFNVISNLENILQFQLLNETGSEILVGNPRCREFQIETQRLNSGIYFLNLIGEKHRAMRKIILTK